MNNFPFDLALEERALDQFHKPLQTYADQIVEGVTSQLLSKKPEIEETPTFHRPERALKFWNICIPLVQEVYQNPVGYNLVTSGQCQNLEILNANKEEISSALEFQNGIWRLVYDTYDLYAQGYQGSNYREVVDRIKLSDLRLRNSFRAEQTEPHWSVSTTTRRLAQIEALFAHKIVERFIEISEKPRTRIHASTLINTLETMPQKLSLVIPIITREDEKILKQMQDTRIGKIIEDIIAEEPTANTPDQIGRRRTGKLWRSNENN